jgi:hypothetical protein
MRTTGYKASYLNNFVLDLMGLNFSSLNLFFRAVNAKTSRQVVSGISAGNTNPAPAHLLLQQI